MAVRSTLVELIGRVRLLVGDTGNTHLLADQDIQDVLDGRRAEVRYELLQPMPDIQPGQNGSLNAQFVWASYQSRYPYWENDSFIQGLNTTTDQPWVLLTPVKSEPITGKWTFAVTLPSIATPPAQYPPVYATGKVYDLYGAAADCLDRMIAAKAATTFDFSVSGGINARVSQILATWEKLQISYLDRAWVGTLEVLRTDLAPDTGPGRTPVLDTDAQSNYLLPGVLGADVTRGNHNGT